MCNFVVFSGSKLVCPNIPLEANYPLLCRMWISSKMAAHATSDTRPTKLAQVLCPASATKEPSMPKTGSLYVNYAANIFGSSEYCVKFTLTCKELQNEDGKKWYGGVKCRQYVEVEDKN